VPAIVVAAALVLSGCARAVAPAGSSPAAKPGRLHTLSPDALPGFQAAFDDGRDTLRYIVVFSPT
jgi:hypothetical protein